jgi:peptide/nickel transport system permease protein
VSGLSFLGFAARPPAAEWGAMIADGRTFIGQAWWLTIFPGVAICWSAISLSFYFRNEFFLFENFLPDF